MLDDEPDDASDDATGDEPLEAGDGEPGPGETSVPDESDDVAWPLETHLRRELRRLHDAVEAHLTRGDFAPSFELEAAMASAKAEADWS